MEGSTTVVVMDSESPVALQVERSGTFILEFREFRNAIANANGSAFITTVITYLGIVDDGTSRLPEVSLPAWLIPWWFCWYVSFG